MTDNSSHKKTRHKTTRPKFKKQVAKNSEPNRSTSETTCLKFMTIWNSRKTTRPKFKKQVAQSFLKTSPNLNKLIDGWINRWLHKWIK